ncbi:osmoprotectant transport system ATP-binding protein [Bacilli bacterium PM5-3]|nr:osmoprotectant transport system ATP-binding protein [Bacilli bacterium PM5-3]MDH6603345.1 osmoprotectant transport system ATP-binding protein [Bacilli bacterium PM5-9]
MIEFKHVSKSYQDNEVIEDLNLTINDGEFVCIIGPSGCGKTTTLKMINRLNKLNGGEILIDGVNINDIEVTKLRQGIGYVIQQIGLFPNMSVKQNISVVPNLLKWSNEKIDKRVRELLKMINMPYDEYADKYPNELSGGQQQRIGVLRALAANAPIILMDEPFGALDPITRDILQDELKTIHKKLKKTIVFVTHDMDEAVKMADRILFMEGGKILQFATPEDMLNKPASPVIKDFLGKISYSHNANDLTCADVMRKKVFSVNKSRKTLECINLMNQRDIGSLIVVDDNDKFLGIVRIEDIKEHGVPGESIEKILKSDVKTVLINTNAKEAFDEFYDGHLDYLTVLNRDKTVAGIITKTSMAKALGSLVWGEE